MHTSAIQQVLDTFEDRQPTGHVIGTECSSGHVRDGSDIDGIISIDNEALRIGYMRQIGWGKHGISYGPFPRRDGLAFAVLMLNGHNNSQTQKYTRLSFKGQIREVAKNVLRLAGLYGAPRAPRDRYHEPPVKQNLAIGWFPSSCPNNPPGEGNCFIMQATEAANGLLKTRQNGHLSPSLWSVQNIPYFYAVVLRSSGATYYVGSIPDAGGAAPLPFMRPFAVDTAEIDRNVYATLYQSVLGETAFKVDSRVESVTVSEVAELASWYGSAHIADRLSGEGSLLKSAAEEGGRWTVVSGDWVRTESGARATGERSIAYIKADNPSGLVHARLLMDEGTFYCGIVWRYQDEKNYWCIDISHCYCRLILVENDEPQIIASSSSPRAITRVTNTVQIVDNGETCCSYLNGELLFDGPVRDTRLHKACGVGIHGSESDCSIILSHFEAHPRLVPVPPSLLPRLPWIPNEGNIYVSDDFDGSSGSLDERRTSTGQALWRKEMGRGSFIVSDGAVRVQPSSNSLRRDRTAYTIDWNDPFFAHLKVEITPPGAGRGQGERGRGGFIFWQDRANYVIVNTWLDDHYDGASLSSFFRIEGKEDLFNAVWTNLGERVRWGVPYRMRVVFDGMRYLAYIDDEPVLYRSLKDVYPETHRIRINRVGLVTNWEWGNDTGSLFKSFTASNSETK